MRENMREYMNWPGYLCISGIIYFLINILEIMIQFWSHNYPLG